MEQGADVKYAKRVHGGTHGRCSIVGCPYPVGWLLRIGGSQEASRVEGYCTIHGQMVTRKEPQPHAM